jgi:hypothetical protein
MPISFCPFDPPTRSRGYRSRSARIPSCASRAFMTHGTVVVVRILYSQPVRAQPASRIVHPNSAPPERRSRLASRSPSAYLTFPTWNGKMEAAGVDVVRILPRGRAGPAHPSAFLIVWIAPAAPSLRRPHPVNAFSRSNVYLVVSLLSGTFLLLHAPFLVLKSDWEGQRRSGQSATAMV